MSIDPKKQADLLKKFLQEKDFGLPYSSCLHAIAAINGYRNWNTMLASMNNTEPHTIKGLFWKDESCYESYTNIKQGKVSWHEEAKLYWNGLYKKYKPYLDENFLQEFPDNFFSRLWELTGVSYLDSLMNAGIQLLNVPGFKDQSKPDACCFSYSVQKKFYVEFVCPTCGDPEKYPGLNEKWEDIQGKARNIPEAEYRERLASAFKEKAIDKYEQGYKEVIKHDGFIVAISMANITDWNQPGKPDLDLSCFFPHSPNMSIPIFPRTGTTGEPYYEHQDGFSKRTTESQIENSYFSSDRYSYVSAVLISHHVEEFFPGYIDIYGPSIRWKNHKNAYMLIHNPFAAVPLPKRILPVSREYVAKINSENFVITNILKNE